MRSVENIENIENDENGVEIVAVSGAVIFVDKNEKLIVENRRERFSH